MRRVSYSSWHHCVSCRQETVREGFPIRLDAIVFLTGRKLFAKGFLFSMTLLCFIATGNYLRRVSCSTWHHCVSYRQETICEGFPIRLGTTVFLADRKLFAKGFLFDMALLCFLPAGNCSRKVSYSAWQHCVSLQQETFCEWFPVRHGTIVFQCDRKLSAKGFLFVMTLLCFSATRNYLRRVSWSTWHYCVSFRQETIHREISRLRFRPSK